jgi:MFS family permease
MNGRRQAITVAFLCGLIPQANMLSPAIQGLVCLRHGPREALLVAAWAILPLLGWAMAGDITPLILFLGVLVLATVLRKTSSWQVTVLVGILVGVGAELALRLRPEFLALLTEQVELFLASGAAEMPEVPAGLMQGVLISLFGVMHMFLAICLVMLARWWQALLFNPGGFQQEFHQFRLQPSVAVALMALFVLASFGITVLSGWTMYFVLPLFFAGVALVHGLVGIKKLSRLWLIAFYMLMLNPPLAQLLAVFALADSWYDFRGRIQKQT